MDRNQELEEVVPNDSDPLLGRENKEAESSSSVELSAPQPATVTPLEIEDEENDASSAACCRICLESESEIGDDDLTCYCYLSAVFLCRLNHVFRFWGCFLPGPNFLSDCSNKEMKYDHTFWVLSHFVWLSKNSPIYCIFLCV
jgi:hypothetical protein